MRCASFVVVAAFASRASAVYFRDIVGDKVELGGADGDACVSFGFSLPTAHHRSLMNGVFRLLGANITANDANFFTNEHRRRMAGVESDDEESLATGCLPRALKMPTNSYVDEAGSVAPVRFNTVDIQVGAQKIKLLVVELPGSVRVYASPNEVFMTEAGTYQVPAGIIASKVTEAVAEVADATLTFPERSCPNSHRRRVQECGARRRRKLRALAGMADLE